MRTTLFVLTVPLLAALVPAQNWRVVAPDPMPRALAGMAFDPNLQRVLQIFGQNDDFTVAASIALRVGRRWNEVPAPVVARQEHGTAVDPVRQRVVVFGGLVPAGGRRFDTLEWNGSQWSVVPTPIAPQIPAPVLCWHGGTARVVLFGATGAGLAETWTWDGISWTQATPALQPPARQGHAMTYDLARDRIVLFGGRSPPGGLLAGTWEWDGVTWLPVQVAAEPPPQMPAMAYDLLRARCVLFGNGTWEYDGTTWMQRIPVVAPANRTGHALAFDPTRGRIVMHGGFAGSAGIVANDTWEWDGSAWSVDTPVASPGRRNDATMTIEPATGCALLHGGTRQAAAFTDTWRFAADGWQLVASGSPIAPASYALLVGDEARGEVVAFPATSGTDRTWLLRGSTWTPLQPGLQPSVRAEHAMAFDPQRGVVVLFGGAAFGTPYSPMSDTWEWNGASWTQAAATGPSARSGHRLAWDPAGGGVLLFGGLTLNGSSNETWRYTATGWQLVAVTGPSARWDHAMASDRVRNVVVLVSGFDQTNTPPPDHWEWNGAQWNQVGTVPATATWQLADSRRGAVLVLDGLTYENNAPPAAAVPYGSGCTGSAGTPRLAAGGLPQLGTARLDIALDRALPGAFTLLVADFARAGGGTGCGILVANLTAIVTAVTDSNGNASWRLAVPDRAALRGMHVFQQCAVLDPGGSFGFAALSNGLDLRLDY